MLNINTVLLVNKKDFYWNSIYGRVQDEKRAWCAKNVFIFLFELFAITVSESIEFVKLVRLIS